MKVLFKIVTLVLLLPIMWIVYIMGGVSLIEGYNIFDPYIDTEFAENYTPERFDAIDLDFTKEEVNQTVGQPLSISHDTVRNIVKLNYTNDGHLRRKNNHHYMVNDYAWYRSTVEFDTAGRIVRIDKGWSYD